MLFAGRTFARFVMRPRAPPGAKPIHKRLRPETPPTIWRTVRRLRPRLQPTEKQIQKSSRPTTQPTAKRTQRRWRPGRRPTEKQKFAASNALRRSRKLRASPAWACQKAIREIYKEAQTLGMVVDHLYPLRGKTVSGLHVEANLRLLCPKINSAKRNKLPGSLANELWNPAGSDVHLGA